jgi:hypothetical protein
LNLQEVIELLSKTPEQQEILDRYFRKTFFINNNSTMNQISKYMEKSLSKEKHKSSGVFDYRLILSDNFKKPLKREFRSKKEYSLHESSGILGLFEILWIFVGFFTGNWYLFGITLALSYLLNIILKPFKFSLLHKLTSFTFLLGRLCLYLYLIVNHFYLHQDTYSIVKHYIKW